MALPFYEVSAADADRNGQAATIWRDLYVYVNWLALSDISTVSETFNAYFYVRVMWVEPGMSAADKILDDTWKPMFMILNAAATCEVEDEKLNICTWRRAHNGGPVLSWSARIRGTFRERLELRSFPFDLQPLTLVISTQQMGVRFHEDTTDRDGGSILRSEFIVTADYTLGGPFLFPQEDLALGKYAVLRVQVVASRLFGYYMWNVYLPVFLLTGMLFSSFAVPLAHTADRMSLTLTVVLASVAYKYVVAQDLPHITYLTLIDQYVLANFVFTAIFLFHNYYVGWMAQIDPDDAARFDVSSLYVLLALFVLGHVVYGIKARHMWNQERKKLHCVENDRRALKTSRITKL